MSIYPRVLLSPDNRGWVVQVNDRNYLSGFYLTEFDAEKAKIRYTHQMNEANRRLNERKKQSA